MKSILSELEIKKLNKIKNNLWKGNTDSSLNELHDLLADLVEEK